MVFGLSPSLSGPVLSSLTSLLSPLPYLSRNSTSPQPTARPLDSGSTTRPATSSSPLATSPVSNPPLPTVSSKTTIGSFDPSERFTPSSEGIQRDRSSCIRMRRSRVCMGWNGASSVRVALLSPSFSSSSQAVANPHTILITRIPPPHLFLLGRHRRLLGQIARPTIPAHIDDHKLSSGRSRACR